jgi:hypothetical protein
MIQSIQPTTPARKEADFYPSLENPAVALCTEAWQEIHRETMDHTKSPYTAERFANKAFRPALPPLTGYRNTCDFIACVGYGMLLGAFTDATGTKLLYAAQVALGTVLRESKTQSRTEIPPSSHPPPHCFRNHMKIKGLNQ